MAEKITFSLIELISQVFMNPYLRGSIIGALLGILFGFIFGLYYPKFKANIKASMVKVREEIRKLNEINKLRTKQEIHSYKIRISLKYLMSVILITLLLSRFFLNSNTQFTFLVLIPMGIAGAGLLYLYHIEAKQFEALKKRYNNLKI